MSALLWFSVLVLLLSGVFKSEFTVGTHAVA